MKCVEQDKAMINISKDIYLTEFDIIAVRLKHELHLKKDYELAEFFKITPQAYNARKKSNNFPIKKLKEILEQRSDLNHVNLRWVLTGKREQTKDLNLISDDIVNKLKELPLIQQEAICMIIKVFHTNLTLKN